MPTLTLQLPTEEGVRTTAKVIGTLEVGWEVEEVSTLTGQIVAPRGLGAVRGLVRDGVSNGPLPGRRVVLSGTSHVAVTGPDGSFAIEGVAEGGYAVLVPDPLLDSLGVSPGVRTSTFGWGRLLKSNWTFLPGGRSWKLFAGTLQGRMPPLFWREPSGWPGPASRWRAQR